MNGLKSPLFWLLFGVFGFPIVCFVGEVRSSIAFDSLRLLPPKGIADFGFGLDGGYGIFLGLPLGIVSARCAMLWNENRPVLSRCFALWGGVVSGGFWLRYFLSCSLFVRFHDFGFAAPPLLWALALVMFAVFARQTKSAANQSLAALFDDFPEFLFAVDNSQIAAKGGDH